MHGVCPPQPDDGLQYRPSAGSRASGRRPFSSWSWARFHDADRTTIVYATHERSGAARACVVDARDDEPAVARPATLLPEGERLRLPWGLRMPRWFAVDDNGRTLRCQPTRMLETAPFYARYAARLVDGQAHRLSHGTTRVTGVGEYLDLDRFRDRGVQFLLRFKMRRT